MRLYEKVMVPRKWLQIDDSDDGQSDNKTVQGHLCWTGHRHTKWWGVVLFSKEVLRHPVPNTELAGHLFHMPNSKIVLCLLPLDCISLKGKPDDWLPDDVILAPIYDKFNKCYIHQLYLRVAVFIDGIFGNNELQGELVWCGTEGSRELALVSLEKQHEPIPSVRTKLCPNDVIARDFDNCVMVPADWVAVLLDDEENTSKLQLSAGPVESQIVTPVGPPAAPVGLPKIPVEPLTTLRDRYQLMEVPQLKGVRLGTTVKVSFLSRVVEGRLRWMGRCGDDWLTVVQFSKNMLDQDEKHDLFDGERLPRWDDEEHVFRLIKADNVHVPDNTWRHADNVRLADVWDNGRNKIGRRVSFLDGRLSGKLVWSGVVDRQNVAAVLLDEGLPPNGSKSLIPADNLIKEGSHICNRITVEPADSLYFIHGDQPVAVQPTDPTVVHKKWPDYDVGDLVRIVENSNELVGIVKNIRYQPESNEILVLVEVDDADVQRPCPRLREPPKFMSAFPCPSGRALWLCSLEHVEALAKKAKEIPKDGSVYSKLDYNVEMKFVDQDTMKKYIGWVRWIGTVMGQRMGALEVDKPGECPTVKKLPQLMHLVQLPPGKDALFVPLEDLDPVLESDRKIFPVPKPNRPLTRYDVTYFGIPHNEEFFAGLRELSVNDRVGGVQLNMAVEVHFVKMNIWRTGVCRWLGVQEKEGLHVVGVELDEKTFEGSSDGLFPLGAERPRRFFWCRDKYGILVKEQLVREDRRNVMVRDAENRAYDKLDERLKATEVEMIDKESLPPVIWKPEYSKKYGIQGKANSCYMDSTLFALFFTNNSFDYILGPQTSDTENIAELRNLMRTSIVNPLRQNVFVGHASVMAFRRKFEEVGKTQGMTYDQKDAEEFLTVLFDRILKIKPLLNFSDGDKTSILQLFFQGSSSILSPTGMLRLSFQELGNVKLKETPRNLIMLIPREGSRYSGFQHLQLDLQLRISEFLESSDTTDRKCSYPCCHEPAPLECHHKTQSVLLCPKHQNNCPKCRDHDEPHHLMDMEPTLELFAVLCIETSHYVTFVRDYDHSADKRQWYFFDSMADRMLDVNVPEITKLNNMEEDVKKYNEHLQYYNVEPHVKRLFTSAYVLLYRNERTLVYEDGLVTDTNVQQNGSNSQPSKGDTTPTEVEES